MSHNYPPPQPPNNGPWGPQGSGPWGPQGGGHPPQGFPPPGPQQGFPPQAYPGGPYPPPYGPRGRRENPALGLALGFAASALAVVLYAMMIDDAQEEDLLGWLGLLIGPAIGFLVGLTGGRNPVLPLVSAALGPLVVYFGQILGLCLLLTGNTDQAMDLFFEDFDKVSDLWSHGMEDSNTVYIVCAGVGGLLAALGGGRIGRTGR
ncbi:MULTISPECIES: hypothetical protein [Streptomyces]|uniref:Uncharacterized protein n=1 Tax=Streptomyces albus (strain ATCC 21838 / DSM 41398 / FERM P-419 / JCM 4703 / NBRC 107858) TaxID=1081613 RepID=A0A0B5EQI2_STRA4|nr:hypothetical protein [Streptomyces sp. SCSIO ZS0520]AJE85023.1 hypothetical protein SLNWT_4647 [Streptomyces albus]AOU79329.1 hypothetical protein SLNHY_4638 [Streptomyces albus]AYN35057.1 hypothetical protein DUI70_4559 [Streptomyces albus]